MNTQDVKNLGGIKSNQKLLKSNMEKSILKFQEIIYALIFVLLKDNDETPFLFGFLTIMQTLQMLAFPFSKVVRIISFYLSFSSLKCGIAHYMYTCKSFPNI